MNTETNSESKVVTEEQVFAAFTLFFDLERQSVADGVDEDRYRNLLKANGAKVEAAQETIRQFGRQLSETTTFSGMQKKFYSIVDGFKDPMESSVAYSLMNRLWDGQGEWRS